jgi:hypothetical protein
LRTTVVAKIGAATSSIPSLALELERRSTD